MGAQRRARRTEANNMRFLSPRPPTAPNTINQRQKTGMPGTVKDMINDANSADNHELFTSSVRIHITNNVHITSSSSSPPTFRLNVLR